MIRDHHFEVGQHYEHLISTMHDHHRKLEVGAF